MKKIYILTAYNLKQNFYTEKLYFTSYKKAMASKEYLINYLIENHNLNKNNIEKHINSSILDDSYNITLLKENIKTQIIKYI
jgi:hypothetical protein|tara:strand:+ start:2916 stop:3161 length:246 start_codon:yes stop_codon:yes gene_type:complete